MGSEFDKGLHEVDIFNRFCQALDDDAEVSGVKKCFPPKPDILCMFVGQKTYFELVRNYPDEFTQQAYEDENDNTVWAEDSVERILEAKLQKSYQADGPIHLLIYDDLGVALSSDIVVPKITAILAQKAEIQFQKIWYFAAEQVFDIYFVD